MKPTLLLKPGVCVLRMIARVTRELLPHDLGRWLPVGVMVVGIVLITGLALHASAPMETYVLASSSKPPVSTGARATAGTDRSKQERNKMPDAQGRIDPVNATLFILIYGSHRPFGFGPSK